MWVTFRNTIRQELRRSQVAKQSKMQSLKQSSQLQSFVGRLGVTLRHHRLVFTICLVLFIPPFLVYLRNYFLSSLMKSSVHLVAQSLIWKWKGVFLLIWFQVPCHMPPYSRSVFVCRNNPPVFQNGSVIFVIKDFSCLLLLMLFQKCFHGLYPLQMCKLGHKMKLMLMQVTSHIASKLRSKAKPNRLQQEISKKQKVLEARIQRACFECC